METAIEKCEMCGGTGEMTTMEYVYAGEPHMAPIGTRPCLCQSKKDEDEVELDDDSDTETAGRSAGEKE